MAQVLLPEIQNVITSPPWGGTITHTERFPQTCSQNWMERGGTERLVNVAVTAENGGFKVDQMIF